MKQRCERTPWHTVLILQILTVFGILTRQKSYSSLLPRMSGSSENKSGVPSASNPGRIAQAMLQIDLKEDTCVLHQIIVHLGEQFGLIVVRKAEFHVVKLA